MFGAWGQWAGALVGGIAAGVAVVIAVTDARRRRREVDDSRAAQARTVIVSVVPTTHREFPATGWSAIEVANHGQLPVTDVNIHELRHRLFGTDAQWVEVAPTNVVPGWLCSVLGPGETAKSDPLKWIEGIAEVHRPTAIVEVSFIDAKGLRWKRNGNAEPERMLVEVSKRKRLPWLNLKHRQVTQSDGERS